MSSKNKSTTSFQRSLNESSSYSTTPKYTNDKYKKKSDTKSTKTRVKKKRQYREVKPPKGHSSKPKDSLKSIPKKTMETGSNKDSHFTSQSFRTPEKGEMNSQKTTPKNENPTFLLIKNLGTDVNEGNVRDLLGEGVKISSLNIIKNSNNVYLKFEDAMEIHRIIKNHDKNPLIFRGKKVKMCLVNKLPLDLNQKSKICKTCFQFKLGYLYFIKFWFDLIFFVNFFLINPKFMFSNSRL